MAATKTKAREKAAALLNEPEAAPLAAPETEEARIKRLDKAMRAKPIPVGAREEYRKLLNDYPQMSKQYGDMARLYRRQFGNFYEGQPLLEEQIAHRMKTMRQELAGEAPTPLELLLIDVVMAAHQDYYHFAMLALQSEKDNGTLLTIERWERIVSSKEQRYLRAIGELARVRRLLNLPAPQINVNMPGGQQVNVNGKV